MKKLLILSACAALLIGCSSLNNKVYRANNIAASSGVGAMKIWQTYYKEHTNNAPEPVIAMLNIKADQVNKVSKEFGTALAISEELRVQYGTNTTVGPMLKASVVVVENQSSNIVWLVQSLLKY